MHTIIVQEVPRLLRRYMVAFRGNGMLDKLVWFTNPGDAMQLVNHLNGGGVLNLTEPGWAQLTEQWPLGKTEHAEVAS